MNTIFTGDTVTVAQRLLGLELIVKAGAQEVGGIITEAEAYTQEDPACHAFGGKKTPRNAPTRIGIQKGQDYLWRFNFA